MTRSTLLALVSAVFLVLAIALGALLARTGERSKMPSPAAERSEATDAGRARTSKASAVDADAEGDDAAPTGASKEPAGQDEQPAGGADEADGAGTDALALRGLPPVDTGPVDDLCGALETSRSRLATSESMVDKLPWQNLDTVGAKKLRIVRDRLKKEVARYERRARARKECGEE